jgi:hypothetical protein
MGKKYITVVKLNRSYRLFEDDLVKMYYLNPTELPPIPPYKKKN